MRSCGEDVTEIEVKPDGSWRVKSKNESERRDLGDLAQWHFPDGTLCVPDTEVKSKMEGMKQIKQEGIAEGHIDLKLGIRKNCNGLWEVSKPEDVNTSSDNRLQERFGNYEQKVIPMSSSATGSGRDGEDPSVNQDGGGNFDISTNGIEMDSISLNVDSAFGFAGRISSAQVGDAEVIVLSDSEGDDEMLISPESIYKKNRIDAGGPTFSDPPLLEFLTCIQKILLELVGLHAWVFLMALMNLRCPSGNYLLEIKQGQVFNYLVLSQM